MKEFCELRVDEEIASAILPDDIGERLGNAVRKVVLDTGSTLFRSILDEQQRRRAAGLDYAFYGWEIRRKYDRVELEIASYFAVILEHWVTWAGEEFGTEYDEESACSQCGSAAIQRSPLRTRLQKIPKRYDVAANYAGEILVSPRLMSCVLEHRLNGVRALPIQIVTRSQSQFASTEWKQLDCTDATEAARVSEVTQFGTDPSKLTRAWPGSATCGHMRGINRISELHVYSGSIPRGLDLFCTDLFVGVRSGLLRPWRMLVCSAKFRQVCVNNNIRGVGFEVARICD